ncbi:hypothetical protein HMPREF1544_08209 [Mucor circinelloides 1006PhL]|uniref:Uncharacterized protein n=1 Tax=Mucor circinelloides f. circinelloides (strain 1006PhL) TaxID=1220926 RepID=S2J4E0_MUCC1|nr:hypothetical protein HMPREF1544_08209 [Mucor circinelloides 1006PhL]
MEQESTLQLAKQGEVVSSQEKPAEDVTLNQNLFSQEITFGGTKFQRHIQLFNRVQYLESTAENLTDTEDDATIPRAFKTTNKNIDHGSGQQKQRSKLEKSKGHTSLDKQVAAFESIKKDDPFSTANTPQKVPEKPRSTATIVPLQSPTSITPAKPACSAILRSVNGASVCTNPNCVLRTKGETHEAHNSMSALAIGLVGLSTVIFGQPIPSFDPSFSESKTEKFKPIS